MGCKGGCVSRGESLVSGGPALVTMMKSTHFWERDTPYDFGSSNARRAGTRRRSVCQPQGHGRFILVFRFRNLTPNCFEFGTGRAWIVSLGCSIR